MRKLVVSAMVLAACVGVARAQESGLVVEHGTYTVHLLLHAIGTEEYTVRERAGGGLVMSTKVTASDRGMARTTTTELAMGPGFVPVRMAQANAASPETGALTEIADGVANVRESGVTRAVALHGPAFVGTGGMPASLQMMMMRYWLRQGRPARLGVLRASEKSLPLEIRVAGHEAFYSKGLTGCERMVRLTRYTVGNLMFGREILWMNENGRLAAVMTFAGGLPQEIVLDEYLPMMPQLVHSGVRQQMLDLAELGRAVRPQAQGTYAIVGARLVDGTGAAAVEHATVLVRGGRISKVGTGPAPAGMRVVRAEGKTLLPGLWEMHSHYSGVEFGPALLSAGVTTARDCGGELEFLTTVRREIANHAALGPRLLLAGLVDSGGPLGFGAIDVNTPAQGVAAVDMYADLRFEQIKVYTQIKPDVLRAITAEAHARGMTVTGHVPAAVDAFEGVADGMDQINHLQFVTRAMLEAGATTVDVGSPRALKLIALLKAKQIVVDPTDGWGEMAGHAKSVTAQSFEPGISAAPWTLAGKFEAMRGPAADEAKWRERMATNAKVIRALYEAGVPIVAGSDTGLIGYGLDRELELYVAAGMTPMDALQTATLGAARAMKLDGDSGSIEAGKRADMVLVDGNPLERISDLRRVVSVIKDGRMYGAKDLGRSVGFNRD